MMKHKPYPKYKPSGIDWIGDIPEGWEVERLANIGIFSSSGIDKKINENEPLVSMVNYTDIYGNEARVLRQDREYMVVSCLEAKRRIHQVKYGDLMFTPSSETIEDIGLSAVVDEDLPNTVFSYHVVRFVFLKNVSHEFKKYLCNNSFVLNQFSRLANGTTRQILGRFDFRSTLVVVPPIEEQQQIANYLDEKTARLDDLIQKKEEMIDILKEKRAAIINQAVTKGLDPNAQMKPSGIDWVGDIPEGWEVLRLKYKISLDPSKNEVLKIISLGDDVTFLPMAYVTEGGDINDENEKKLEDVFNGYTYFRDNDVVVAKITPCFENGKGALIKGMKNGIGFGTTEFFVLRSKSLDEKYLFYLTKSDCFRKTGEASMKGAAGQKRIPDSFIKDFKIGFPEQTEQKRIASYLDKKTTEIDGLINKIESAIAKLREYRSSLITAAVTGKIDVRG